MVAGSSPVVLASPNTPRRSRGALLAAWFFSGHARHDPPAPLATDAPPRVPAALEAPRDDAERTADTAAASPYPTERDALVVLVRSPSDAPLGGADVRIEHSPSDETEFPNPAPPPRPQVVARRTTDESGRCAFELAVGRPYRLTVEAGTLGTARRAGVYAGETVVVRLEAPARVTGRVSHVDDGEPVADALVRLTPEGGPGGITGRVSEARTDSNGLYSIDRVQPGRYALRVLPTRFAPTRAIDLELAPGQVLVRDVAVETGGSLRGVVRAAESGIPLPEAEVSTSRSFRRASPTDAQGRFVLEGISPFQVTVHARAPGRAVRAVSIRERFGEDLPSSVEILLRVGRRARGRVVDTDEQPLSDVYVAAAASVHDSERRFLQHLDWRVTHSGPDGRFELEGLDPELRHVLVLHAPGRGFRTLDFPVVEPGQEMVELGDIVLPSPAELGGRVIDAQGSPLGGVEVVLRWRPDDAIERPPEDSVDFYVRELHRRTDSQGRFLFRDLEPAHYTVEARLEGLHDTASAERNLAPGQRCRDLSLTIDVGLALSGRIVVEDGGPVPKTYLSIDPEHGGRSADVEAGPDGRFFVRGLSPGSYRITAYPYPSEADRRAGRGFSPTVRPGVPAGARDVEIRLVATRTVSGRVFASDGMPVPGAVIRLVDQEGVARAEITTDEAGRFVAEGRPSDETGTLAVFAPGAPPVAGEVPAATLDYRAGDADLEIVLPP